MKQTQHLLFVLALAAAMPATFGAAATPDLPAQAAAAATLAKAGGTWKWTTTGRNGQPEEAVLKLDTAGKGGPTGTLSDRSGTHAVSNISVTGQTLTFSVVRETPSGKIPVTYTLTLDDKTPKVSIERPDPSPAARKTGKTLKTAADLKRDDKK